MDYNAIARKVETKTFSDSKFFYRKVQELNAAGDVISEYLYHLYNGKEYLQTVTKYTYDANRKETSEYSKVDDSCFGLDTEETKKTFEYDAQGQLTRVNETTRTNNGPENSYYTVYTLSEQGTKLGRKYDNLREQLDAIEYYDEAGNLIQEDVYVGIYLYKTNFWKYDAAGNPVEYSFRYEESARAYAGECEPGAVYLARKYEYDSNGNETACYFFAHDGEITDEHHYAYNEKNEKIKATSKVCRDGRVAESCVEFTYEVTIQEIGADAQPASASPDKSDFDSACTMYETACNYYNGEGGVERNDDMAFFWTEKTTTTCPDLAEAWVLLGKCYSFGVGTAEDHNKAISAYEKAAALGNVDSMYALAEEYYFDREDAKDRAVQWLDRAVEKGNVNAMALRGYMYLRGEGGPQDVHNGERLLIAATEKGDAEAARHLGQFYDTQDAEKAGYYYTQAVTLGSSDGRTLFEAGEAWLNGYGVERNTEKAFKCFEQVILIGDEDVIKNTSRYYEAAYILGMMYCEDTDRAANSSVGEALLRKAINCKYSDISANAANTLGYYYYNSDSHIDEAIGLFRQAAATGNSNAQVNLGRAYYEGKGVPKNLKEAVYYWEQAAAKGNQTAVQNLETILSSPSRVMKSTKKSTKKAAISKKP